MSKLWLIVVVALLSVLGCKAQTVQVRFAREYNCPQGSVQTVDLGGGAYRATGCGRTVTYSCEYNESGWGREIVCRAEGEATTDPSWGQPRYTPPQTQYQPPPPPLPPPQTQYPLPPPSQPQYSRLSQPQPQYVPTPEPPPSPPPPPTYVPPQTQYVPPSQPVKPEDFPPPEAAEERYRGAIVTNLAEMIVTASLTGYGKWSVDILQAVGESGMFQLQYTPFFSWYRNEIEGGWDPSVGQMTLKYFGYGGGAAIGFRVTPLTERGLDSLFLSLRVPLGYMSVQGDICSE
jgi:hypothetical protein